MHTPYLNAMSTIFSPGANAWGWQSDLDDAPPPSARGFHDSCQSELALVERLSQWTEWLDRVLARRFATSVLVVGGLAGFIATLP